MVSLPRSPKGAVWTLPPLSLINIHLQLEVVVRLAAHKGEQSKSVRVVSVTAFKSGSDS